MIPAARLARPYAHAALDYALENKQLEHWADMLKTMSAWVQQPTVAEILKNPKYTDAMCADICLALGHDILDANAQNFIKILATYQRLALLPVIYELFEQLRATIEKTLHVTVKSAIPLNDSYREKLYTSLSKKLGQHIELTCEVDAEILGGLFIQAGDRVIDGSVRGQLERLRETVMG